MKTAVLKFGGTSVATEAARANALVHIRHYVARGYGIVAVVSAMGRKGAPYATDTLLSLLRGEETSPRTRDLIMSCGETVSACVFADALCAAGIPAVPMNGMSAGIRTDGKALCADITGMDTSRVTAALNAGQVAVITGFQGVDEVCNVNTLGRGGSDTSAVVIGGYLKAEETVIYTDVPGVAAVDPRIVPEAKYVPEMDYDDMLFLAEAGSGVVHPRAVAAGKQFGIDVWVRSTFDDAPGTVIRALPEKPKGLVGIARKNLGGGEVSISLLLRPVHESAVNAATKLCAAFSGIDVSDDSICITVGEASANDTIRALYAHFSTKHE